MELCRLAVTPHPLVAAALGELWPAIIGPCDPAVARQHITAVHDLLEAAAAAGAGAGPYLALSPLAQQLAALLACLLSAASPGLAEDCLLGFLQASALDDTCSLACLSAELQVAKLAGAAAGSPACMAAVQTTLQPLSALLGEAAAVAPALDPASEEATYLAWLIDCTASGIAALGSAGEVRWERQRRRTLLSHSCLTFPGPRPVPAGALAVARRPRAQPRPHPGSWRRVRARAWVRSPDAGSAVQLARHGRSPPAPRPPGGAPAGVGDPPV